MGFRKWGVSCRSRTRSPIAKSFYEILKLNALGVSGIPPDVQGLLMIKATGLGVSGLGVEI